MKNTGEAGKVPPSETGLALAAEAVGQAGQYSASQKRVLRRVEERLAMMKRADNRWADVYVRDVNALLRILADVAGKLANTQPGNTPSSAERSGPV